MRFYLSSIKKDCQEQKNVINFVMPISEEIKKKREKAQKEVGMRIFLIRDKLNLTQDKLYAPSGYGREVISNYEKGIRGPGFNFIFSLIHDFHVNPYYLFFGWGKMFNREQLHFPKK